MNGNGRIEKMHCNALVTVLLNRYIVGPVVIAKGVNSDGLNDADWQKVTPILQAIIDRLNGLDHAGIDALCRSIYEAELSRNREAIEAIIARGGKVYGDTINL